MKIPELPPLDRDVRTLIDAARGADEPNEFNRARVRRAVDVKLATGVGVALVGSGTALAGVMKAVVVTVVLVSVVGVDLYVRHHQPGRQITPATEGVPAAAPPAGQPLPPAIAPPLVSLQPSQIMAAPPVRRRSRSVPVPIAAAPADPGNNVDLAEEVRLLGAANGALARHDVVSARTLLGEYDRRPGVGVLVEERAVAGILVSCAEGRVDVARADARRFHARWPRSPLSSRVDGSCVSPAVVAPTASP